MKRHDEGQHWQREQEIARKIEWMEVELRLTIREAEILSQRFHSIVKHARRLSAQMRPPVPGTNGSSLEKPGRAANSN